MLYALLQLDPAVFFSSSFWALFYTDSLLIIHQENTPQIQPTTTEILNSYILICYLFINFSYDLHNVYAKIVKLWWKHQTAATLWLFEYCQRTIRFIPLLKQTSIL